MKHKKLTGLCILLLIILAPIAFSLTYNEKISKPSMKNNDYSIAVSNFIKEKCGNCKDVMIVGDDFVVPGYRREIPTLTKKWFFWMKEDLKNIYTDIPYIKKSMLYLSEYKEIFKNTDVVAKEGKYEGKNVLFILPDSITSEQRTQIERLKKAFNDKGYKPDYSEKSGTDTFCLDERWFADVKGKTLIIIGTEENNNAFKCMPFVAGDANLDSAFMQPNVWDNQEYALVINTDNPEIIGVLANLVETGEIIDLKSESAYFFKVGVTYASYAALGVGVGSMILFTGGSAAPAIFLTAGAALDTISDIGDATDSCMVNNEGNVWCGTSIGFAALPYVPAGPAKRVIKKFADSGINSKLKDVLDPVKDLIEKHLKRVRKIVGNIAFENGIKTVDDNIHVAKGAEFIEKNIKGGLDKFEKNLPGGEKLRLIKTPGKYVDDVIEKYTHVPYTGEQKFMFRGVDSGRVPTKEIDGKLIPNWDAVDQGTTQINQAAKSLDYIKSLPEAERKQFAELSMAHVGGSNDIFISASKSPSVAAKFADENGYVFIFNTRSRNALDMESTIQKQFAKGEIPLSDYKVYLDNYASEFEVDFIGEFDAKDILGIVKTEKMGVEFVIKEGSFILNPKYIAANIAEDKEVAKDIIGGVI